LQIAVIGRQKGFELGHGLALSDRYVPLMTWVNGTLMARPRVSRYGSVVTLATGRSAILANLAVS
jgi:hypothetical protein